FGYANREELGSIVSYPEETHIFHVSSSSSSPLRDIFKNFTIDICNNLNHVDGEPPMWTKEFQCGGNESALLDCRSSDRNTCSPGTAAGLICSEPVRLVGGFSRCTGTLQVKRGDWRPVDVSDWTLKEAAVACGELDCGSAVSTRRRKESSRRSAWKISQTCINSGFTLRECVTPGSSSSIMEITCS
ncbi:scavenger receptor cysteine-rich type 1 protein M130-like, partial [Etheostoma cragini]|uniref:scavenger receptor cysteine-rich type 1 protein M130-like n=1 Tax=Etheostoma cragini TaxID=417921 RepID=UPI00155ED3BF